MKNEAKGTKDSRLQVVMKKVSEIIPYTNNPRQNESTALKVKRSIEAFGFKDPIILDENNIIVSGHARLKAAIMMGMDEVPCTYAMGLSEEEIKAFRIADNKTAEIAGWDYDKLVDEMTGLAKSGFNLDFTGFNEAEQIYYANVNQVQDSTNDDEEHAEADVKQVYNVAIVCENQEDRNYLKHLIHETKRLKKLYSGAEIAMMAKMAQA